MNKERIMPTVDLNEEDRFIIVTYLKAYSELHGKDLTPQNRDGIGRVIDKIQKAFS